MATDTRIRIKRNPYNGYEVWLWGNGELTRRSFDNSLDLSAKLADDCFDDEAIEAACDMLERLEWHEPEYPLGVSYVGDSVTSKTPDSAPRTAESSVKPAFFTDVEPSPFWEWAAATLRVGAVVAPWAFLMLLCRLAYAKAAGWGW